jgi:cyclic-di-AMP phosphodiesterase PgpH
MTAPTPDPVEEAVRRLESHIGFHLARWLPMVGVAALTYLLFPVAQGFDVPRQPQVGEVSSQEVLAPFAFDVSKAPTEIQREADQLAAAAPAIYDFRTDVVDSLVGRLDTLFADIERAESGSVILERARAYGLRLTGEEAQYLQDPRVRRRFHTSTKRMIERYLGRGVAAAGTVANETSEFIWIRDADGERLVERDSVLTLRRYLDRRTEVHPDSTSSLGDQTFVKLLQAFFTPSIVPNVRQTQARRQELRAGIDSVKDHVQANERIVAAHEVITPEARDRLVALRQALLNRGGVGGSSFRSVAGQMLTNGLIVSVFWLLLSLYLRDTYGELRQVLVLASLFSMVVIGAAVNRALIHDGPELIPIPFAAVLITVLFNGRIAMVAAMVMAVLLGSQAVYGGQDAFYIALIGGVAAALSVRRIRRRSHILASAAVITGAFALASMTVALRVGWSLPEFGTSIVRGATNATVSAALVFLALPIFESLARVSTDLTLLELSDPSHPLLRRLATEVPGTYAHSVAVANLCEPACNAIGGNGLLARVGCYYHDVGKMHRPLHFAENQGVGGNPHDRLPPETSASIIRDHVTEGLALAEEHHLPDAVKAFIPEHHGTREISYFLDRASKEGVLTDEDRELFRYPGPVPQSIETAVAMLADGVEAAIRVLEEPTAKTLRDAIDHVVRQRIEEGQLDQAPITLGDLEKVKEEFMRTLSGMYHNRIDYPEEVGGISAHWSAASRA